MTDREAEFKQRVVCGNSAIVEDIELKYCPSDLEENHIAKTEPDLWTHKSELLTDLLENIKKEAAKEILQSLKEDILTESLYCSDFDDWVVEEQMVLHCLCNLAKQYGVELD